MSDADMCRISAHIGGMCKRFAQGKLNLLCGLLEQNSSDIVRSGLTDSEKDA